jgi:hypothetical protein
LKKSPFLSKLSSQVVAMAGPAKPTRARVRINDRIFAELKPTLRRLLFTLTYAFASQD